MEEEKIDLEMLKKGIEFLNNAMHEFTACELIDEIEDKKLGNWIETLQDRAMLKEIELKSYRMEEI
jgi:hypothetical protein